ncbi:malonate decarboxylase subunit alpha [Pseudomonas viciae]|uniref:malonate decarboxylase subunit alpha n=1 Tax=Pseudomonas viciae TaxID=2505979 RepID=UPI00387822A3
MVLEGNNQKAGGFFSRAHWPKVDPAKLHDLHMIMPSVGPVRAPGTCSNAASPRKLDFFLRRHPEPAHQPVARRRFCWRSGAIHTYIELYARLVVDLIPQRGALGRFSWADPRPANIYTGPQY